MRARDQRPQRRKVNLLVSFWRSGGEADYRSGRVLNMSATGVYIDTELPFPPPTILELRFLLDGEPLQVQGEVIRSLGETQFVSATTDSGMGVRFCDPDSEDVRAITGQGLTPSQQGR